MDSIALLKEFLNGRIGCTYINQSFDADGVKSFLAKGHQVAYDCRVTEDFNARFPNFFLYRNHEQTFIDWANNNGEIADN